MKKLKLGFIVDDISVSSHMYELINSIIEENEIFEKPTLIVQKISTHHFHSNEDFYIVDHLKKEKVRETH
tara:strand:+ start:522 stop:731 length:210 start_codon:yes stop_codon:yes gene_type:complete